MLQIQVGKRYKEREGGDVILIVFDTKTLFPTLVDDYSGRFVGVSTTAVPEENQYCSAYGYSIGGKFERDAEEYDLVEEVE